MLHSSSFHSQKTKNMPRDYHDRKIKRRHRFRDVSHMKLMNIINSLRHRRLRRDVPHRSSSSSHSRCFPPPFADHDLSPVQPLSPDLSISPSLHISRYRSDAASILSVTEEDCSSGMSTSSPSLEGILSDMDRGLGHHVSPHSVPTFPTFPNMFQLRSTSKKDYLVERLEQHLGRLCLGDIGSPDRVPLRNSSRDIPMDVSPQRTADPETSSHRALSERNAQKPTPSPHDQNVVPMILITSVDAKHAKPLPPSDQRPSRTPFGPSNLLNHPTNVSSAESKQKTLVQDDPFTTHPGSHDLFFSLPSIPLACSSAYTPETPTPMYCDHPGDCSGDLWEILHPPLVMGRFTLPPFTLPPLRTGLFDDVS